MAVKRGQPHRWKKASSEYLQEKIIIFSPTRGVDGTNGKSPLRLRWAGHLMRMPTNRISRIMT